MLNNLFINILSMSTIASIVFIVILFVRQFMKNKIDLKTLSLLWIIFIITLIIPLNFESKISIKNFIKPNKTFILNKTEIFENNKTHEDKVIGSEILKDEEKNFDEIIFYIWCAVVSLLISKDILIYRYLNKNKSIETPEKLLKILQGCQKELNIKKEIKIVIQDKVKMPSIYGIFHTKIFLTKEIIDFSEKELKCIIIHELNHYKNKHHILYLLFGIIQKIHWFNPLVNIAFKIIKQDLEIITDKNVLESDVNLKEYCKTILKVTEICSLSRAEMPSICSDKKEIERRIKEMKKVNINTKTSIIMLAITLFAVSLITVSLASEKISDKENSNKEIVNDIFNYINNEIQSDIVEKESVEYIIPIENAKVSRNFGKRVHPITKEEIFHSGIDLIAEKGQKVKAAADGTVIAANFDNEKGNYIEIKHLDGSISGYHHGLELLVKEGDTIKAGDCIMLVGSTGKATGPHLHFEVKNSNGEYLDVNGLIN